MAGPWVVRRALLHQYVAAISACLSGVTCGSCAGWMTPVLDYLLSTESEIPLTTSDITWVVPVIEVGNFLSSIPAGFLAARLGRKPLILVTGPFIIISWLLVIFWPTAKVLALARFIMGFSTGLTFTATPVYLGEIACDSSRGAITSILFNCWWIGYIISYFVGAVLSLYPFIYFTLALNIPFVLMFIWQPESPYYLVMKGQMNKAYKSLKWFRDSSDTELKSELEMIKKSVEAEAQSSSSLRDLVATAADRKALTLIVSIAAVRMCSGTGGLLTYIGQVFDQTPNLTVSAEMIVVAFGVVMLIGGTVSTFTTDWLGRRPLLLLSSLGSLCCTFLLGTYYFLLTNTSIDVSSFSWLSPTLILLYAVLCSTGLYPVNVTYISELFGSNTRGFAASITNTTSTIFSFTCLALFQPLKTWFGFYANFYMYSTITLLGFVYFYHSAPETKEKSFAEIRNMLQKDKNTKLTERKEV